MDRPRHTDGGHLRNGRGISTPSWALVCPPRVSCMRYCANPPFRACGPRPATGRYLQQRSYYGARPRRTGMRQETSPAPNSSFILHPRKKEYSAHLRVTNGRAPCTTEKHSSTLQGMGGYGPESTMYFRVVTSTDTRSSRPREHVTRPMTVHNLHANMQPRHTSFTLNTLSPLGRNDVTPLSDVVAETPFGISSLLLGPRVRHVVSPGHRGHLPHGRAAVVAAPSRGMAALLLRAGLASLCWAAVCSSIRRPCGFPASRRSRWPLSSTSRSGASSGVTDAAAAARLRLHGVSTRNALQGWMVRGLAVCLPLFSRARLPGSRASRASRTPSDAPASPPAPPRPPPSVGGAPPRRLRKTVVRKHTVCRGMPRAPTYSRSRVEIFRPGVS